MVRYMYLKDTRDADKSTTMVDSGYIASSRPSADTTWRVVLPNVSVA